MGINGIPKHFSQIMKETGTDLSVIAMLSFSEELGGIELSFNDFLHEVLKGDKKGLYLAYAGVDPRLSERKKIDKINYYINEAGFIGIKLNPNDWGTFSLDDPMLTPIF